jgi:two-component system, NarL family, response regulator NreC
MQSSATTSDSFVSDVIKVLLVDDHPVMRAGVKLLLDAEPDIQVVAEAADGREAIRLARELQPDLIVLDVSLPEVGGAEAAAELHALEPKLRILALSAHAELAFAKMMLTAGAAGYAVKRSQCDELLRAVRAVARGDRYLDPSITDGAPASAPASDLRPVSLSEREKDVVQLSVQGYTSKEMSETLGISPRTLETYKARAMAKLNVSSRADLFRYALRAGWLKQAQ